MKFNETLSLTATKNMMFFIQLRTSVKTAPVFRFLFRHFQSDCHFPVAHSKQSNYSFMTEHVSKKCLEKILTHQNSLLAVVLLKD